MESSVLVYFRCDSVELTVKTVPGLLDLTVILYVYILLTGARKTKQDRHDITFRT